MSLLPGLFMIKQHIHLFRILRSNRLLNLLKERTVDCSSAKVLRDFFFSSLKLKEKIVCVIWAWWASSVDPTPCRSRVSVLQVGWDLKKCFRTVMLEQINVVHPCDLLRWWLFFCYWVRKNGGQQLTLTISDKLTGRICKDVMLLFLNKPVII